MASLSRTKDDTSPLQISKQGIMVAEKGHPHPHLKAARQTVKAARQMQKYVRLPQSCTALVHAVQGRRKR